MYQLLLRLCIQLSVSHTFTHSPHILGLYIEFYPWYWSSFIHFYFSLMLIIHKLYRICSYAETIHYNLDNKVHTHTYTVLCNAYADSSVVIIGFSVEVSVIRGVWEQCIYNGTTDQFNLTQYQGHTQTQRRLGNSGSNHEIQLGVGNVMKRVAELGSQI